MCILTARRLALLHPVTGQLDGGPGAPECDPLSQDVCRQGDQGGFEALDHPRAISLSPWAGTSRVAFGDQLQLHFLPWGWVGSGRFWPRAVSQGDT